MKWDSQLNPRVFFVSSFTILIITLMGSIWPAATQKYFSLTQLFLITHTSWLYVLGVGTLLFFSVWLALSRYGDIRLGPDHMEPEYSLWSWFAMLFSTGMGSGLLFFAVAEPLLHFSMPPVGPGLSIASAREAMKITFFHWGLHAWAIYAMFAILLAYFSYRRDLPLLPRSICYPFLGDRIFGIWGDIIDISTVVSTLFGVATSLGLSVTQVSAGLERLVDVPATPTTQIILIIGITLAATVSVALGLDGGLKKLSHINMILGVVFMLGILLLGPTMDLFKAFVQNSGAYLSDIVYKTFNLYTYEKKQDWIGGWTLLYWGWWVSWSPFVGIFIARISKGRTIREFLLGVILAPTAFTCAWMTIFGNTALDLVLNKGQTMLAQSVQTNIAVALFDFLALLPGSLILSGLAVALIITFFVSSADSGALVIDILCSGGAKAPPVWQRVYWSSLEGLVAIVLLLAGGLHALQTMTIIAALPVLFLLLVGCWGLVIALREDFFLSDLVQRQMPITRYAPSHWVWKKRLRQLHQKPTEQEVRQYILTTVRKAMNEFSEEFNLHGKSEIQFKDDTASLTVFTPEGSDFLYQVCLIGLEHGIWRAEVFLGHGGQGYDIFDHSKDQIISDILSQYESHLKYLEISKLPPIGETT